MVRYHRSEDLAPRDIVARAVEAEIKAGGGAYLDARSAIGAKFPVAFPTVFASCQSAGIDPRTELMPVAPAAHYHMGGVRTDLDGRTNVEGLWAVGEVASTGVHGANRLASNSLLEAIVFGARIADELREADIENLPFQDNEFDTVVSTHTLEHVLDIKKAISELRRVGRKRLIIVVPKQRPYNYTFDLHVHFFPYKWALLAHMTEAKGAQDMRLLDGDWYYQEDL